MPKKGSQFIYLSVILIDSAFKTDKDYSPASAFRMGICC